MNTQTENMDAAQSQCFDPFPEPQTIPSGWDLSGFASDEAGGHVHMYTGKHVDTQHREASLWDATRNMPATLVTEN